MAVNLIHGGHHEATELEFDHWAHAGRSHADGGSGNTRFSQWAVKNAVNAVLFLQSGRDAKDTAEVANILAVHDHGWVMLECQVKCVGDGGGHRHGFQFGFFGQLRHAFASRMRASSSACCAIRFGLGLTIVYSKSASGSGAAT
jgi:hypothetical protein